MKKLLIVVVVILVMAATVCWADSFGDDTDTVQGYVGLCGNFIANDTFSITKVQSELKLSIYLMQYQARPDETLGSVKRRLNCRVVEADLMFYHRD